MPRITADQAEQIGNSGQNCFFGLGNDKDQALVRFLINDQNDLDIYPVHRIELNGMTKSVECLRAPGDPIDACPFCREKYFSTAKIYIPLIKYSVNGKDIEPEVNIWKEVKHLLVKCNQLLLNINLFIIELLQLLEMVNKKIQKLVMKFYL